MFRSYRAFLHLNNCRLHFSLRFSALTGSLTLIFLPSLGNGQWRANSSEVIVKACLQHITLLLRLGLSETRIGSHNRLYWIEFAGKEFDAYGVLQRVQFPLPEDGFEFVKE